MGLTSAQLASLAIIPKIGGLVSFIGSGLILREVIVSHYNRNSNKCKGKGGNGGSNIGRGEHNNSDVSSSQPRQRLTSVTSARSLTARNKNRLKQNQESYVYQRLLGGMSCCDMAISTAYILSTWTIPKGTPGAYHAIGNNATCQVQGFLVHFGGTGTPVYNACLAVYYLMVVKYGWNETQLRKYAEPWLHFTSVSIAFTGSFIALMLDLYGNATLWCWIVGEQGNLFRFVLGYVFIWMSMIIATICMVILYRTVRRQEQTRFQYNDPSISMRIQSVDNSNVGLEAEIASPSTTSTRAKRRRDSLRELNNPDIAHRYSRQVLHQAVWYLTAFYLTWIFATINRLWQLTLLEGSPYIILLLHATFAPCQGFFNLLVYMRPRYLRIRKQNPTYSRWQVIKDIFQAAGTTPVSDTEQQASSSQNVLTALPECDMQRKKTTTSPPATENDSSIQTKDCKGTDEIGEVEYFDVDDDDDGATIDA